MNMENIPSRLNTLRPQIIESFINELEERYTSGEKVYFTPDDIEKIRRGEKIHSSEEGLLIRIAQDFRLSHEETDHLVKSVFE